MRDNTKHLHIYVLHYHKRYYRMFSGVAQQFDTACCFSTVAVCLINMAHDTKQRLSVIICLCAVCIHIWPPVSAIWITLVAFGVKFAMGMGHVIEIYTAFLCVHLAWHLSSWLAHVSAGLRDSQFIGLWVRPIFLALSTHNSAFRSHSAQALRVMIHMYSIS